MTLPKNSTVCHSPKNSTGCHPERREGSAVCRNLHGAKLHEYSIVAGRGRKREFPTGSLETHHTELPSECNALELSPPTGCPMIQTRACRSRFRFLFVSDFLKERKFEWDSLRQAAVRF